MISPELKKQEYLRRLTESIVVNEHYIIESGTIGYLVGQMSTASGSLAKIMFISLCERFQFDVTNQPSSYFQSV